jgi:putative transposase
MGSLEAIKTKKEPSMKPTEIDLTSVISKKFLMPENMLIAYLERINLAMPEKNLGRHRTDMGRIFNGIYYMLRTGVQWDALPYVFGKPRTVYHWFSLLSRCGFFEELWAYSIDKLQENNMLNLCHQSIDSTHRKAPAGGQSTGASPVDRAKTGSKIVIQTDTNGLPIGLVIASSNCSDQKLLKPVFIDTIGRIKQKDSAFLHTDKGFDSKSNAEYVKSFCMTKITPARVYKKRKQSQLVVSRDHWRWVVERTISWLGRCRRVFTRYERLAKHYLSWVQLAAQRLCFSRL